VGAADTLPVYAFRAARTGVTLLYSALGCLVAAQVVGIYGLVTHKADLVFSACMVCLLVLSFVLGALGAYQQLA
jgi:hypothetical protein